MDIQTHNIKLSRQWKDTQSSVCETLQQLNMGEKIIGALHGYNFLELFVEMTFLADAKEFYLVRCIEPLKHDKENSDYSRKDFAVRKCCVYV